MTIKDYMGRPLTVAQAIQQSLDSRGECSDQILGLTYGQDKANVFLSELVTLLIEKGVITEEEIEKLL